jgi:hypothetical protein
LEDLQRLLAVEEIRKLKARFFRCLDTKDWDALSSVLSPDMEFNLTAVNSVRDPEQGTWNPPLTEKIYRGRDTVLELIRGALEKIYAVHSAYLPEIDILSDKTARGVWAMEDMLLTSSHQLVLHGYGYHHDTYERIDRTWLIKSTRITRVYLVGGATLK